MKRAIMIFALVSIVAGVALAQLPRSSSEPSAAAKATAEFLPPARPEVAEAPEVAQARATPTLTAHRAPVPMVLSRRTPAAVPATAPDPALPEKATGLTEADARAAILADGYKKVLAVGKTTDGTWRARALRGTIEVVLRVDARGNVIGE
ncbi:MAG: hypothetical protein Q8L22_04105 [Reyranella sp.]|nr:hypothetical protein [Reyranella sp.]